MKLLKQEVELFNKDLHLVCDPTWLSKADQRQEKKHSSAVLAFSTKEEAQSALRRRLVAAGISLRTVEYTDTKSYDQCIRCQKYGHMDTKCQNTATCQICAEKHHTRDHTCHTCNIKTGLCGHTVLKCVNCLGAHKANNPSCETFKAVKPYSKTMDPLSMDFE